jgi:hypothetical protein
VFFHFPSPVCPPTCHSDPSGEGEESRCCWNTQWWNEAPSPQLRTAEFALYTFYNANPKPGPIYLAENKNNLAKAVIANAVRGGTKIIPVVGALLEQTIYGTKDQVAAKKEADQVKAALAGIRSEIETGTANVAELLDKAGQQAALSQETAALLEELIAIISQGDSAEPSEAVEKMVEGLFQHLDDRLEDAVGNVEAAAERLVQALETLETRRSVVGDVTDSTDVDRLSLISALNKLDSVSLGTLIVGLRASHYVSASAAPGQRVTDLLEWAEGAGPGLPEVYRVARQLIPNFP